jgi:DNA-binding NarL/FixJ family response regulator
MSSRILIADDCSTIRRTVRNLLEREGFDVVGEAADGAEAVRLAEELSPDVIVLDLSMPVLDGLEAAREIHRLRPQTPLILLTIHTAEENILAAMRAGILACVAKSDAGEDLPRAIREVSRGGTFLSVKPARVILEALLMGAAHH